MISIATIVEGDGEVAALPVLLRRMAAERHPEAQVQVLPPIRVRRDRFIQKDEEFQRQLVLAAAKSGDSGWVLIVLDADDDCPAEMGQRLLDRAKDCIPHRRVSVVLANREFEAWFIAARESLAGVRGLSVNTNEHIDAEVPRDAKGWLRERMKGGTYSPILDQPAFAAKMDLQQAIANSRSFTKLCKEWDGHMAEPAGSH